MAISQQQWHNTQNRMNIECINNNNNNRINVTTSPQQQQLNSIE